MKITVDLGGHAQFRVQHAHREDLYVSSALTGVQAVEKVAEWLANVPAVVPAAEPDLAVVVEANDGHATFRERKVPRKEAP